MNTWYVYAIINFMISFLFMAAAISKQIWPIDAIPSLAIGIAFMLVGHFKG